MSWRPHTKRQRGDGVRLRLVPRAEGGHADAHYARGLTEKKKNVVYDAEWLRVSRRRAVAVACQSKTKEA